MSRMLAESRLRPDGNDQFHGWGSRIAKVEYPDRLVFDLDPDVGLDFAAVRSAAVRLRGLLADLGLIKFPLLTGGKGIHVVAPLDAKAKWPRSKASPSVSAGRSPKLSRKCSPPTSARPSARAASSSTGSATSAARRRSCLIGAGSRRRPGRHADRVGGTRRDSGGNAFRIRDAAGCRTGSVEAVGRMGKGKQKLPKA